MLCSSQGRISVIPFWSERTYFTNLKEDAVSLSHTQPGYDDGGDSFSSFGWESSVSHTYLFSRQDHLLTSFPYSGCPYTLFDLPYLQLIPAGRISILPPSEIFLCILSAVRIGAHRSFSWLGNQPVQSTWCSGCYYLMADLFPGVWLWSSPRAGFGFQFRFSPCTWLL